MKNRILFMAVACLMGMAVYAQWSEPEYPSTASDLVAGHKYQIKNAYNTGGVEAYVGASNGYGYSWSTSVSMLMDRDDAITYIIDQDDEGWTLVNDATGKYTFISGDGSSVGEAYTGYCEMHVDMAEQGHNHFGFEKQSDGSYHITATYDVEGEDENGDTIVVATYSGCWGWIVEDEIHPIAVWGTLDASNSANYCNWILLDVTTYAARLELYNVLVQSLDYEGVDVSHASSVYNDPNASVADLEAAVEEVKKAINESITAGASEDNPKDVTVLIGNADFSGGSLSPWQNTNGILVYSGDTFPNGDCNLEEQNDYESWVGGFAGWVSSSTTLGDEDLYQDLGDMPAGMYMITLSMVAQHSTDMPEGVFIYANSAELELKHDEALWAQLVAAGTTNQLIEHPELTFLHEGGDMRIGVKLVETNCNWVYGSKWQMIYYGETEKSAAYFELQSAISEAQAYTNTDTYHYSQASESTLETAIAAAQATLASVATDATYEAATAELNAVLDEVKAEVSAYVSFNTYVEQVESDRDKYDADGWDDISATLSDLYYEVAEHYTVADLSADEIQAYLDAYDPLLVSLIEEAMPDATTDHPLEVTLLYLQNANLTEGSMDPWENTNSVLVYNTDTYPNSDCNVWEQNNNVTYNRWLAAWQSSSSGGLPDEDVHQTISDLPAGSYVLSCMMVAQHGEDMPSGVYLYSNSFVETKTEVKHDATLWEQLVEAGTYNQLLEYPTHTFYHTGGDVTVGIRLDNTNCNWVYASKFTLSYAGEDINALYESMMQMVNEAVALDDEAVWVQEADDMLIDAIEAAEDCSPSDEEAILAAMEQLQEAINYANESIALMEELETKYVLYADVLLSLVDGSDDESYLELLEDIADAIYDGYESNEQIQGFISDLATGYTQYVQYNVLDATEDNPGDVTLALVNADFEGIDGGDYTEFWDMTVVGGTNSYGYDAYECYNNTSFRVSQTVLGLAEGYYRVRLQGFYRPGTNAINADTLAIDPDYGQNVIFFANDKITAPLCNVITGGSTEALGVDGETSVEYNGETLYLPNSMSSSADYFALDRYWNTLDVAVADGEALEIGIYKNEGISSDWTIWSEFQLLYLGTTAPTAIESVYDNESVAAGQVAKTQYYSLDGTLKSHLTKGINIIKTTLVDGSVNVQKVLVK